ncbi:Uncharacterised protein [Serratia fonticola]|uniref:Uncharacterized protein n=1 Tax=Serratia fonticola TaxID=47917 RepID=A0A4U9UDL4_SERFO|nr:Uncharacterised protein [Serratia fonticola]
MNRLIIEQIWFFFFFFYKISVIRVFPYWAIFDYIFYYWDVICQKNNKSYTNFICYIFVRVIIVF